MPDEIGFIEGIFRYPVKSMAGERLEAADLGWQGLEGDRKFAIRRIEDRSHFPWLTAAKLGELVRFAPLRRGADAPADVPTHVRTPEGQELPVFSPELAAEIARRHGAPVEIMRLKHGVFDEATVSVIALDTVREVTRLAGVEPDVRRFRPNVLVRLHRTGPFQENAWPGCTLTFGADPAAAAVAVTLPDVRCSMLGLDPDTAAPEPAVLKAVARANQNHAGIYGTVLRAGRLSVGQPVFLEA